MSDTIAELAKRFWSVLPKEIQDLGITREQFYEREMRALFTTQAADRIKQLEARLDRAVTRGLEQVEHIATLEAALREIKDKHLYADQYQSIASNALAQSSSPKVLLPCPVCGGEAIHMIDTLKRIIILDDPEWNK